MHDRRRTRRYRRRVQTACDTDYDFSSGLLIQPSNLTVYDTQEDWVDTGVLAPDGDMIQRSGRETLGFLEFDPQDD